MTRWVRGSAALVSLFLLFGLSGTALAQKPGGILRIYHRDSPASMSVHEEGTIGVIMPMMGVFNNLVMFDQNVKQNSDKSIVPDLATGWSWNEDHTALTFKLRDGVKWHDGKPFTSADVKCTFDLLTNQAKEKLRLNYRDSWWVNLRETTVILGFIAGKFDMSFPYEVTFPLLKDIKNQAPQSVCEEGAGNESVGVLMNRTKPPFDNPDVREALALTIDRKSFIDILGQGE